MFVGQTVSQSSSLQSQNKKCTLMCKLKSQYVLRYLRCYLENNMIFLSNRDNQWKDITRILNKNKTLFETGTFVSWLTNRPQSSLNLSVFTCTSWEKTKDIHISLIIMLTLFNIDILMSKIKLLRLKWIWFLYYHAYVFRLGDWLFLRRLKPWIDQLSPHVGHFWKIYSK